MTNYFFPLVVKWSSAVFLTTQEPTKSKNSLLRRVTLTEVSIKATTLLKVMMTCSSVYSY